MTCPYGHADCTPADCKDGEQAPNPFDSVEFAPECPHSWVQHNPLDEYSSSHCEWCGEWRTGNQEDLTTYDNFVPNPDLTSPDEVLPF